MVMKCFGICSS